MPRRLARQRPSLVPAMASCALLGTVVVAGVASQSLGGSDSADTSSSASAPVSATLDPQTTALTTTTALVTTTSSTTTTAPKTQLTETLGDGSYGDEVTAVQERLKQLGFDPGPIDGDFGSLTRAAVWAFEKLVMQTPRAEATGRVTNEMWQLMQEPLQVVPRRPDAASVNHTEIYLPEQVVVFFREDKPALISHMSSGTGEEWCEEVTISPGERGNELGLEPLKRGECGVSKTPGGVFVYDRQRTGAWESGLGTMWNPAYFNFGIAIHGAMQVPLEPASHGCIRIPMTMGEYFQSLIAMGDQVFVFDGLKEPEEYDEEEKMMIFNRLDPNYTTTTSSTTTTAPPPPTETDPAPLPEPPADETTPAAPPPPPEDDDDDDDDGDGGSGGAQSTGGGGSSSSGDGGGGGGGGGQQPAATQPLTAPPTQATSPASQATSPPTAATSATTGSTAELSTTAPS